MTKHIEIKTIEIKGIKVTIKIDYDKGQASLVEYVNHDHINPEKSGYQTKQWFFGNRGLGYMDGWLNILEAITGAVKECKKDLEFSLAQSSKFEDKEILKVAKALKIKIK